MAKTFTIGPRSSINFNKMPEFAISTNVNTRQAAYDAFQKQPHLKKLTDNDRQQGVRVYSSVPIKNIEDSLSRKKGYALPLSARHNTKYRVIASKATYIGDSSGNFHPNEPVGVTMLTSCAPNLRLKRNGRPENPNDYKQFVDKNGRLNADAYREEMKGVWHRFLLAANEEAKRTGKKIDILTPLAGGGAYLDGLKMPDDKNLAKEIIVESLILAANEQNYSNIGEINLSIPNNQDGSASEDFKLAETTMAKAASSKITINLSNTDVLTLGREMKKDGHEIAICNPGSDHIPGGGAYNDRGQRLGYGGGHGYNPSKGASLAGPGEFNGKPNALEEQLGQLSNFLYLQNQDQNPNSFSYIDISKNAPVNQFKPAAIQPHASTASRSSTKPSTKQPSSFARISSFLNVKEFNKPKIDRASIKEIATKVKANIPGIQNTVWITVEKNRNKKRQDNYRFSFQNHSEASAFAQEIFNKGIESVVNPGFKKGVSSSKDNKYHYVYLTKDQYRDLAKKLDHNEFSKQTKSRPAKDEHQDIRIEHDQSNYQLIFAANRLEAAEEFLSSQLNAADDPSDYDQDSKELIQSKNNKTEFKMEFITFDLLTGSVSKVNDQDLKAELEKLLLAVEAISSIFQQKL